MASGKFESPLPHFETLSGKGFPHFKTSCAKNAPKMEGINYKDLKLVKGKRWYVEFYYRIPDGLRPRYDNREWERFRWYGGINKYQGEEKARQASLYYETVKINLNTDNYNPFEYQDKYLVKKTGKSITMLDAISFYKQNLTEKGVEPDTVNRYKQNATLLETYLIQKGLGKASPEEVDENVISDCLQFYKKSSPWSNRNYNNHLGYFSIMFNFLIKKKKLAQNPCNHLSKMKFVSHKHRYYDEKALKAVIKTMKEKDPYLYLAAQFVYYAGVRSAKEMVGLQVGDILLDRDRIRFKGNETKGKKDDYIFLDPKLKSIIEASRIMDYPSSYYIFTYKGKPSEKQSADDFIQERFRKIRKDLKLSEDYTLYSFKHTRAVHLLIDGAQPVDIMQLFRHTDLAATTKYIRDLGFDLQVKFADKSRDL